MQADTDDDETAWSATRVPDFNRSLDYLERPRRPRRRPGSPMPDSAWGALWAPTTRAPSSSAIKGPRSLVGRGCCVGVRVPPHPTWVNFAPRVKIPVLMIIGRYDNIHRRDRRGSPCFSSVRRAGTGQEARHSYESGHTPQPARCCGSRRRSTGSTATSVRWASPRRAEATPGRSRDDRLEQRHRELPPAVVAQPPAVSSIELPRYRR